MGLVISSTYVISASQSGGGRVDGNNPLIGYDNLVTTDTITTDTAAEGFPASNLANPSTNLRWVGEIASPAVDEHITVNTDTPDLQEIDYIAIARHNLFTAQIPVSVEYLDVDASPAVWVELIEPVVLPNDGPALFRFPPLPYASIRLRLQPGDAGPSVAVVYCGKLLVLQRRIHAGHTPMPYARETKVVNGRSESGEFLGRIVTSQMTKTSVSQKNITPDWYRANMEPFLQQAQENPFFFAWRPGDYPLEVGYAWLTNDPMPANALANGMVTFELEVGGIA